VYDVGENNYDNNKKKHRRFGGRKNMQIWTLNLQFYSLKSKANKICLLKGLQDF
jgi:hypothetical protein